MTISQMRSLGDPGEGLARGCPVRTVWSGSINVRLESLNTLGVPLTEGETPEQSNPRRLLSLAHVVVMVVLMGVVVLAGCSTARQREATSGPTSLLTFRDPATRDYFSHVYRTGNLYLDFRPALVVDAIVEDQRYRALYVKTLSERFLLPPPEIERLEAEQARLFDTQVDILVFTYEGMNRQSDLIKKDAPWRMLLRDDDGQLLTPLSISRIKEKDPVYLYIEKHFGGLDRWSRVYRVSFPKLAKRLLGRPVGEKPFQLLVTGIKGTVTLQWDNPGIFYREAPR